MGNGSDGGSSMNAAVEAVFVKSGKLPTKDPVVISGPDFLKPNLSDTKNFDLQAFLGSMKSTGFQATALSDAVDEVNRMIDCRLKMPEPPLENPIPEDEVVDEYKVLPEQTNCTIFLSYTSNMVSSGIREVIRYLVQHSMVDCIITTAGAIEEDLIKCLAPTFLGHFQLNGAELRKNGINRIGNLLIPNDNYCHFEDWLMPILTEMLKEQKENNIPWSPSRITARLGKEINNESSVLYWAFKNKIPVFCPAITDGSLGDMLFFHSYRNPGLLVDILSDLRRVNT